MPWRKALGMHSSLPQLNVTSDIFSESGKSCQRFRIFRFEHLSPEPLNSRAFVDDRIQAFLQICLLTHVGHLKGFFTFDTFVSIGKYPRHQANAPHSYNHSHTTRVSVPRSDRLFRCFNPSRKRSCHGNITSAGVINKQRSSLQRKLIKCVDTWIQIASLSKTQITSALQRMCGHF